MTWGPESPELRDRFEARVLPSSEALRPEDSTLLGVGAARPEADASHEAAGLTGTADGPGKSAWKRRLAPRHRRAVGTFFGRDQQKD